MSDVAELTGRIERLETRLTHQDLALEDLNSALTSQWHQIDRLTRQVALLNERIQTLGTEPAGPAAVEPPPPHY